MIRLAKTAKRLTRLAIMLLLLGLLALGGLASCCAFQRNREVVLPRPTGPYPVGRVAFDWTDTARVETLAKSSGARRELLAWVWYPATTAPDAKPADYLPENWRRVREQGWGGGAFLMQNPASIRCHSLADAPVSRAQPTYPVLIIPTILR